MPGGEVLTLRVDSAGPGPVGFDQVLAVPAGATEVAAAALVAIFADGTELRQEGLGTAVGDPAHALSGQFQTMLHAREPGRMLEVGSRARSGIVRRGWTPAGWEYSGFDIIAGRNVDVVGDAHALSRHYPRDSFDAVMAFSVLEHLLMPWKFVVELNRVLKPDAIGMFSTHQCWPIHDHPWDFWRFSDTAWTGLLNPATGFEIIAAAMGEPAYVVAQRCSAATAFAEHPAGALASFVVFRKIGETRLDWPVELEEILSSRYPGGETEAEL
jgi:SAM-dependent methyltransferase